ncbi:MAG TPA: acyl-CoA desaturase [Phycisphaerales bacterium]|nr:acyl-CoA desaturase [Phycisphaerales bacterium]
MSEQSAPVPVRANRRARFLTLMAVILPPAGLIAGIIMLWGVAFNWTILAVMVGMYLISGLGITIGYHRLFTHKSFETYKPIAFLLGVSGSMALEGPVMRWVATHRKHHQHSDGDHDPHSPHTEGEGVAGILKGIWHSHVGWIFDEDTTDLAKYVPDLQKDKMVRWVSATFPIWVVLGLAIPTAAAGLLTMSWYGALLGLLWGGFARIFFVHHATWSVNSVCHLWGSKTYRSHDESRNNPIVGILALGEGWHNNHHAFPTSARHGLAWWQFDISYIIIKAMEMVGLVWKVRVPTPDRLAAAKVAVLNEELH